MSVRSSYEQRAEARRARLQALAEAGGPWSGGLVDPAEDRPPVGRTVVERLQMVADASAEAWALSGRPWPSYERASMPGRVIRRGETP